VNKRQIKSGRLLAKDNSGLIPRTRDHYELLVGQKKYVVQNVIFHSSKITHFLQNFVQISNFRPNLVYLLKGI